MDKIAKALARLSKPEQAIVKVILRRLLANDLVGLDMKKLKGQRDIYRVRKGDIRIIYRLAAKSEIYILAIERRSETTYGKW
ncbi:MAG: type II toxin-antitoxin system RelE/ParE family toxin [Candidatus Veblenbacteria bacterium]|nr:type II toxin-antitoxin system RelE/ParE family toxin [Candidatus Veblenbacteria bacterium]